MSVGSTEQAVFATYPSLRGRTAFVSGGASGLGAEFVTQLAGQGARVAFIDIDTDRGKALEQALRDRGADGWFLRVRRAGRPCSAGGVARSAEELARSVCWSTMRPTTIATRSLRWTRRCGMTGSPSTSVTISLPPRRSQDDAGRRGGSIINLGSISAKMGTVAFLAGYITAKAGIEGLTRTMAREYGPWHIRVNCIIPGWIMTEKQLTEWVTPEAEESIARNQCLPDKLYPDDVARLLLWLAADDSRSCTAQRWIVDGGWM